MLQLQRARKWRDRQQGAAFGVLSSRPMLQSPICPAPARRQPKAQRLDREPREQSNAGIVNLNSLQQSRAKSRCQTQIPGSPRKARRRWWQGRRRVQERAAQAELWRTVRGGGRVPFGVFAGGGPWKNKGRACPGRKWGWGPSLLKMACCNFNQPMSQYTSP